MRFSIHLREHEFAPFLICFDVELETADFDW
jgi:hypothetical protein